MLKNKLFLINIILLIIVIFLLVYVFVFNKNVNSHLKQSYYAVYLQTGDMYFGKLSRFPKLILSDVWYLQKDQNGFSLAKFTNTVFNPQDKLEINRDKVIWIAKLQEESGIVKYIQTASQQPVSPLSPTTTINTPTTSTTFEK